MLTALEPHLDAVVLVGAQAVYLRTEGRIEGYQPFTTDADLVLDPSRLEPIPPLGETMIRAGFTLTDEPGIWEARFNRPGFDEEIVVPVDLIVPEELAPKAGRRAARLPGDHGTMTARKSPGLAGAIVDNSPIELTALGKLENPSRRPSAVEMHQHRLGLSERRACRIVRQYRSPSATGRPRPIRRRPPGPTPIPPTG